MFDFYKQVLLNSLKINPTYHVIKGALKFLNCLSDWI